MSYVNIVAIADDLYFIYEADSWERVSAMATQNTIKSNGMAQDIWGVPELIKNRSCILFLKRTDEPAGN
jgi:hypothetical protein